MGTGGGGVAAGATERMVYHRLIVIFDDSGVVASARMQSVSCWEKSLQQYSSPACVDVHGYDVASLDTLRTEEMTEVQVFQGLYWYPGIHGFESMRGLSGFFSFKVLDEFRQHTPGSLVVGESFVYFFAPDADRETAPILKVPYDEITEAYLDSMPLNKKIKCIVMKRKSGAYDSFGVWDPNSGNVADVKAVEAAGTLIESRRKAATARH